MSETLPCPHCGCDQIQFEHRDWVLPHARYCRNCRMYGPVAKTAEGATQLWNQLPRRAGGSIDDASPAEWDEASGAAMDKSHEVQFAVESAQRIADLMGREVYIVDLTDGLRVRTESRFKEQALEIVHPSGDKNAQKSSRLQERT